MRKTNGRGPMNLKDMGNVLRQAQQLQGKLEQVQRELEDERIEAAVGGGMVKVVANGKQDILSVRIDPGVVDPGDVEMLEDLVLAAVREAKRLAQELATRKMGEFAQLTGLPLP
jgi:DNA-binding YbaB/EbfC family protein